MSTLVHLLCMVRVACGSRFPRRRVFTCITPADGLLGCHVTWTSVELTYGCPKILLFTAIFASGKFPGDAHVFPWVNEWPSLVVEFLADFNYDVGLIPLWPASRKNNLHSVILYSYGELILICFELMQQTFLNPGIYSCVRVYSVTWSIWNDEWFVLI